MSLEKNKALVRKGNDSINRQDLTVLDEFMAPDFVDHTNQLNGREAVKQLYAKTFKDAPDFHRAIEDMVAEGDQVWVRFKITVTPLLARRLS